jgi:hypothetical protein
MRVPCRWPPPSARRRGLDCPRGWIDPLPDEIKAAARARVRLLGRCVARDIGRVGDAVAIIAVPIRKLLRRPVIAVRMPAL